ncbi:MAG: MFS transporter [Clostridiales bacterium]|nr:MFS transporter [Clostridiales bacterium]
MILSKYAVVSVFKREKKFWGSTSVFYAAGYIGIAMVMQVVVTWAMYFYAPPPDQVRQAYLSVGSMGAIMGFGRLIDAITDPVIGTWSDNTNTLWGRRLPFIFWGGLPLSVFFILLWRPPLPYPSTVNFFFAFFIISGFFLFYTIVACPFLALIPEMAKSKEERLFITSLLAFFYIVGLGIAMLGSALLIERLGFATMGLVIGLLALLSFYSPLVVVREKQREKETKAFSFREALNYSLHNRPFIIYICCQPFFWFGFNLVLMGLPYIIVTIVGLDEQKAGLILAVSLGVALLSFPLINYFSRVKGKKNTFIGVMAFASLVVSLLPTIGHWPLHISSLWQAYILVGTAGIPLAGMFILPNAIMADITDYDELITGRRREAFYYGIQGFVVKMSVGISAVFLGALLQLLGYTAEHSLGVKVIGPLAGIFIFIGTLLFFRYPVRD